MANYRPNIPYVRGRPNEEPPNGPNANNANNYVYDPYNGAFGNDEPSFIEGLIYFIQHDKTSDALSKIQMARIMGGLLSEADGNRQPIHVAAATGNTDILAAILDFDPEQVNNNEPGHTPIVEALADGKLEAAKLLQERGANMNGLRGLGGDSLLATILLGRPDLFLTTGLFLAMNMSTDELREVKDELDNIPNSINRREQKGINVARSGIKSILMNRLKKDGKHLAALQKGLTNLPENSHGLISNFTGPLMLFPNNRRRSLKQKQNALKAEYRILIPESQEPLPLPNWGGTRRNKRRGLNSRRSRI
jgi:ankyrin repeat protein